MTASPPKLEAAVEGSLGQRSVVSPTNTCPPPSLRQREEDPTGGIGTGAGAGTGDWVARAAEADWLWIVTARRATTARRAAEQQKQDSDSG